MNKTIEQLEKLKYNFHHAPDSHHYGSESIREIVCDCLELHKELEKCYDEIADKKKTIKEQEEELIKFDRQFAMGKV